jgi:hypothetical protein
MWLSIVRTDGRVVRNLALREISSIAIGEIRAALARRSGSPSLA